MLISFELTMPSNSSWNGKWTGDNKKFYVVEEISKRWLGNQEYFKDLIANGKDDFSYSFGDGWVANIEVEVVGAAEAKKRKKQSIGFAGYEWMIRSIKTYGEIKKPKYI